MEPSWDAESPSVMPTVSHESNCDAAESGAPTTFQSAGFVPPMLEPNDPATWKAEGSSMGAAAVPKML